MALKETNKRMKVFLADLAERMSGVTNIAYTLRRELIQKIVDETRDIDQECGYPTSVVVADYKTLYDRNAIASRIIDLMPEECWVESPEVIESEQTQESKFEKAWKELEKEHSIFNVLERLDKLSGIGRFGILLLGLNDGGQLKEEVTSKSDMKLIYLRTFSENAIRVKAKDNDSTSPRYGQPAVYALKTENVEGVDTGAEVDINWTRCIHVMPSEFESRVYGTPRMQSTYNNALDIKKLMGGAAEMFWKGGFPGYAFKLNPDRTTPLTTDEKSDLKEEFENFSNRLQRYFAMVGVDVQSLEMQVADPASHFKTQLQMIAIALGVPYRIFMGTEEAKLASSQDVKIHNKRVKKRQISHCTVNIIRPFIDRLIEYGVLETEEYVVKWPDVDTIDPKDEAQIAKDRTEAMSKYFTSGMQEIMGPHQYLTLELGYTSEEAEDILKEAEDFVDDTEPEEDDDL
jgi:hypothetical protein